MKKKILVAEDDAGLRDTLVMLFQSFGFIVIAACDGVEAERLFREDPDIRNVLSDVHMPGLRGDELHARIADDLRTRNGTFVAHTGYCQSDVREYFSSCGVLLGSKPPRSIDDLARCFA